jgi:hypothetical protein
MNRARIKFKNGYQLSVVQGDYSYGGDDNLFEIAPFTKEGSMTDELFDEEDSGDTVLGYCDIEKVNHYILKISSLL